MTEHKSYNNAQKLELFRMIQKIEGVHKVAEKGNKIYACKFPSKKLDIRALFHEISSSKGAGSHSTDIVTHKGHPKYITNSFEGQTVGEKLLSKDEDLMGLYYSLLNDKLITLVERINTFMLHN